MSSSPIAGRTGRRRQLHLNAFLLTTGHHEASWRLPQSDPLAATDVEHYKKMARVAEKGTFDSLFLADSPSILGNVARRSSGVLEPLTLLTVLAGATERIGLIATASTSYNSPYNLARRFASLDHVSGGRAGWNIVTTSNPDAALNVPRSPQGYPVLVQAGSSDEGKSFAARYAEAIFTAQQTIRDAQSFYADIKARASWLGRGPTSVQVLPGLVPIIGGTEAEARRQEAELEQLLVHAHAQRELARLLDVPVERLELDRPLPDDIPREDEIEAARSRFTLIVELARREKLTVRQLIARLGGGRGHRTFAGTPEQVAATIEDWFCNGAADGFNIMPAVLPTGLEDFVEQVVPILRARGLFRTEYEGRTLRQHYGLKRPENQHAAATSALAPDLNLAQELQRSIV